MKRILLFIGIGFLAICGCKKQQLYKQIDGNWTITRVVYSGGTLTADSVVTDPPATLFFEKCTAKENGSVGNCTGDFTLEGNEVGFAYKLYDENRGELDIYATPPTSEPDQYNAIIKHIAGSYEIVELSNSALKIKSACCTNWPLGADTYRIHYIEASK